MWGAYFMTYAVYINVWNNIDALTDGYKYVTVKDVRWELPPMRLNKETKITRTFVISLDREAATISLHCQEIFY